MKLTDSGPFDGLRVVLSQYLIPLSQQGSLVAAGNTELTKGSITIPQQGHGLTRTPHQYHGRFHDDQGTEVPYQSRSRGTGHGKRDGDECKNQKRKRFEHGTNHTYSFVCVYGNLQTKSLERTGPNPNLPSSRPI